MTGKIKGITVEIGGDTTKLGNALADSEKKSRDLQGELRAVEKALKFNPGNVELIAQKQELLKQVVEETTNKLDTLKGAYSQVQAQAERGEIGQDQFREFQRELIETESKLNHFDSQLNKTEDEVKDVGESAQNTEGGFTIMKGALADITANVITSAISSIGNLIGSLMDLSEATEEYRQMQGKLAGSADTFGYSVDFANSKYKEFYNYLGDDQMATNAVTNLMGLGTSTDSVSKLAEGAISVWSAYGDSIPIESLTESINETAQVGKVTGVMADALNWAGVSEDEFNAKLEKCTSTQERADLIAQTLNGTYGESKKTYDELNGSITDANEAELALKDTQAQLGEAVAPVNTAFTNLKNQALEAILPLVEKLATKFMDLLKWLKEHPTALKVITALIIALATAFGVLATALAIQGLISGVTKAFALLNATILANPIVLVTALIAGLVAGFIYLWNNCESFRKFWINLWNNMKSITKTVTTAIVSFFKSAWTGIKNAWSTVGTFFSNIWSKIKSTFGSVKSWFTSTFSGAWTAIKNVFSGWGSFFSGLWSKIKSTFSNLGTNIANAIGGSVKSAINGVISKIQSTINSGIGLINGAIGIINKLPGVNIGKISKLSLPRLAKGGIVDSPTIAEIGENGREAIIPLEKNTGWLREVARELNANITPNNTELVNKLDDIYNRLDRLQIVLDTGTLVGETIDKYDRALSDKHTQLARGW